MSAVFRALASDARRAMVRELAQGEKTVKEIAARHSMSLQAVSKHLRVLERAGLVRKVRSGRVRRCRMGYAPLLEIEELLLEWRRPRVAYLEKLEAGGSGSAKG